MTQKIFFAYAHQYAQQNTWYLRCLQQAAESMGAKAIFARDRASHTHILHHVSDCIDEADIGFYDITGLNPNVLIEYGIGHKSDKPSFLLLNKQLHIREIDQIWGGKRSTPLPIPADLEGIIRYEYMGPETLIAEINRVVEQNLNQQDRQRELVANSILDRLRSLGPSNMSAIAKAVGRSIDDVRPILKALVATDRVVREGHARGSTYRPA